LIIYCEPILRTLCRRLRFSVIGAGGVGQVIVRHLAKAERAKVKVGDINRLRLREIRRLAGDVTASRLNAGNTAQVEGFIKGSDVVINASDPRFNLVIMKQALKRKVHYIDLASQNSLFVKQQTKQDQKWKRAGLVAVLGMGEDPGLSNIMARRGADLLDSITEIRIRDGETSTSETYPFVPLFAPAIFLEEAASPGRYFEGGELKTNPPLSRKETYSFPEPIGNVAVYGMDHEEVHSLPRYLPKKPNYVDFKLALTDETANAIRLFHEIGLLNPKPIRLGKVKISPLNVLLHLLPSPSQIAGKIHGSAGILVEIRGEKSGEQRILRLHVIVTHDEAYEKYGTNATSYLTGTPTAVCSFMLAKGEIENRGVIVPECLNAENFLNEASRFNLRVQMEDTKVGS
jgi:saccharopine dehydrogenase (NAD+, L-lysine-forming)